MGIREELEAEEAKLRGIRLPPQAGSGHHFGKSGLSKRSRKESDKAPTTDQEGGDE